MVCEYCEFYSDIYPILRTNLLIQYIGDFLFGVLGRHNEDYILFSTRASSYMHSLCKWGDLKCHSSATWFFWGYIDIRGNALFLFNSRSLTMTLLNYMSLSMDPHSILVPLQLFIPFVSSILCENVKFVYSLILNT